MKVGWVFSNLNIRINCENEADEIRQFFDNCESWLSVSRRKTACVKINLLLWSLRKKSKGRAENKVTFLFSRPSLNISVESGHQFSL